jgi:hypothetical protein
MPRPALPRRPRLFRHLTPTPHLHPLAARRDDVTQQLEFFSATMTVVPPIFIAREWLIYDKMVFRSVSIRPAILLLINCTLVFLGTLVSS